MACELEVCVDRVLRCTATDLSVAGVRLRTNAELPYGMPLFLEIELPGLDGRAQIGGIVRWSSDGCVGVQFMTVRAREAWAIQNHLRSR